MGPGQPTARERGALWASTALLAAALLVLEPGRILPETKLDVLIDPVGMLGRALGAWDPTAGFGRLQNQAVGYLFPMGAVSALGRGLGLPPWVVQRLWLALVLSLSLWGAHRVARALGVGGPSGRLVAAWAYALAPATMSLALFQSAGQLPYALAPHVLAPLLAPRPTEGPRRTAARSALWVAAMGGVNGASTVAVLPLVVLWFATRAPGPARRRLAGWWIGGVVAATLWWLLPLLVSVRWGLRFTDYTESAATTTVTESATEILRGTGNWLSYLQTPTGWWLPGSRALAAAPLAIVATIALAAGGLAGLARRDAPERRWLTAALLLGAAAMGAGWAGSGGGPAAGLVQDLLDGPLAPFRNVHKLAAVVRLPLALGLGHLVAVATARAGLASVDSARSGADPGSGAWRRRLAPAGAALAVGLAVVPLVRTGAAAPGSFADLPSSWRATATWLEANDRGGRALVLPASAFGEYRWGRPLDEPLSSLLDGDWAVRDLVPLGGNGSTRLLDGLDAAFATESLPVGAVASLERMGVTHLVVRNDLDLARTGGPGPVVVRRLLDATEGLERVASFGDAIEPDRGDGRRSPRPGAGPGGDAAEVWREIDVWAVPGAEPRLATYPTAGALVVSGGPEGLLGIDPELLEGRATVLATDAAGRDLPAAIAVQTDTARRRDVEFGAVRDRSTATLQADEPSPLSGGDPVDRWAADAPVGLSVARLEGAAELADDRVRSRYVTAEAQPFSAFDGNPDTAWTPQFGRTGETLTVTFEDPVALGEVVISLPRDEGKRIRRVAVTTDAEQVEVGLDGARTTVALGGEPTRRLAVELTEVGGAPDLATVGIAEVALRSADGDPIEVRRPIVAAPLDGGADVIVLRRDRRDPLDRIRRDEDGRFDRLVDWAGGAATVSGTATVGDGALASQLLAGAAAAGAPTAPTAPTRIRVEASSTYRAHPATAPERAFDGNPATAWVSEPEAGAPTLRVAWDRPVLVDAVLVTPLAPAIDPEVDAIAEVVVSGGGERQRVAVGADGRVDLPIAVRTAALELAFPASEADASPAARTVGVAEVEVPALGARSVGAADDDEPLVLPCGSGPTLRVDGEPVPTEVATTVGRLRDGGSVPWRACESAGLAAGTHRIEAERGALFASTITMAPADDVAERAGSARPATVRSWGAAARTIALGSGAETVLATTENVNDGWRATAGGEELEPIRVDGWRQGWIVPAGSATTVELRFAPDRVHRGGLLAGVAALLGLVAAALAPERRRRDGDGAALADDDRRGRAGVIAGVVAVGVLLAGPFGLVAVPLALARSRRRWLVAVAVAAAVAAGAVAVSSAGATLGSDVGTFSWPAQWLAVLALVATGVAVASDPLSERARAGSTPSSPRRRARRRR